jgi:zinc finger CCCH domain-containing protein 13
MASRRERERGGDRDRDRDRDWDRGTDRGDRWPRSDRARDDETSSRRDRDKDRWDTEDRDSKPKRGERGGRGDRRNGGADDKEDRKERDKDKTPAWMDTYVPTTSGGGILGGKGDDGELDELQAWKKTMKERELAKAEAAEPIKSATPTQTSQAETKGLDEIQQFKLMMQQAQTNPDTASDSPLAVSAKASVAETSSLVPETAPAGMSTRSFLY